jgi:hypothetical protein
LAQLAAQLEAQLRPVLRAHDFEQFDLNRAFDTVAAIARTVSQMRDKVRQRA